MTEKRSAGVVHAENGGGNGMKVQRVTIQSRRFFPLERFFQRFQVVVSFLAADDPIQRFLPVKLGCYPEEDRQSDPRCVDSQNSKRKNPAFTRRPPTAQTFQAGTTGGSRRGVLGS